MDNDSTDEMAQLKAQVMQLTERLGEQEARAQLLVEQRTRLEGQAQLARDLQGRVKQQIFERQAREKVLVEQNARLEERARLSRDLHDSVKQQMFALAVQIELARTRLDQDRVAVLEHLTAADELSYQIQQELSTLIDALRPTDLQAKGLTTALRGYLATWSRQTHIMVDLAFSHTCWLPSAIEEALWRVTQEAFSNVARHSQATRAKLYLEWTAQQVTLTVSDNGQGFDPQAVKSKGMGLCSIRERIEQVGGTVLIHSRDGVGTQVIACCPLPQPAGNEPGANEVSR